VDKFEIGDKVFIKGFPFQKLIISNIDGKEEKAEIMWFVNGTLNKSVVPMSILAKQKLMN